MQNQVFLDKAPRLKLHRDADAALACIRHGARIPLLEAKSSEGKS